MVENISAINNIIRRKSQKESLISGTGRNKNRLTDNLAPEERNSPLCSTPFVEKYRGKSIYKFSPIAMGNLDDSGKATEVENDSIFHVDNKETTSKEEPENKIGVDIYENIDDKPSDSPILTSKGGLFSNSGRNLKLRGKASKNSPKETNVIEEHAEKIGKDNLSNGEKKSISNAEDSVLYKSSVDSVPFLGFTKTSFSDSIMPNIPQENDVENFVSSPLRMSAIVMKSNYSLDQKSPNNNQDISRKQLSDDMFPEEKSSSQKSAETMEASVELEPFLGFTDSAIKKKTEVKIINESQSSLDDSEADITMVDVNEKNANKSDIKDNISSQSEKSSYESDYDSESQTSSQQKETGSENITANETDSDDNSAIETENESEFEGNTSNKNHSEENDEIEMEYEADFEEITTNVTHLESNSENTAQSDGDFDSLDSDNNEEGNKDSDFEKQSLYNTCNSIESEEDTSFSQPKDIKNKQPIVVLDRISDSTFKRYYNKSVSSSSNDSSVNSSNHSLQLEESICDDQNNSKEDINEALQTTNKGKSGISKDTDSKETHISFVTTRRGHGNANESLIMILDDSSESSSSEGNKTVLSNHGVENKPSDNNKLSVNPIDAKKAKTSLPKDANSLLVRRYPKISNVRESTSHLDSKLDISEMKPSIVLQPGKKWERSLSIYKRMTMQSDFEQSILEDEEICKKGRKYRQSVIHTMEMQETQGKCFPFFLTQSFIIQWLIEYFLNHPWYRTNRGVSRGRDILAVSCRFTSRLLLDLLCLLPLFDPLV